MAHNVNRQSQCFSSFFRGHAAEVLHLDQPDQVFVFGGELFDGVIKLDQFEQFYALPAGHFQVRGFELDFVSSRSFLSGTAPRVINEDLPHDARRHRQKVDLVREFLIGARKQFEVRLMDERRRLKRVVSPLAG